MADVFGKRQKIEIKTAEQIALMREAGLVVATTLETLRQAAVPGVTTADLDALARGVIAEHGATPSFLGYHGFPAVICTSVNSAVVHGIPDGTVLQEGDLLSIDCGAIVQGWHGDAAITVSIGTVTDEVARLSETTREAMWAGLRQARAGNRLSDIGHAVEKVIRAAGPYGVVEEYVGHGIGSKMHMYPSVPNYGQPGQGPTLEVGMALAIEPMATLGSATVRVLDDEWTVVTDDDSTAAHWEHTVAITEDGPWVLTALDDIRL
jgi:methionyl aminopeptidase